MVVSIIKIIINNIFIKNNGISSIVTPCICCLQSLNGDHTTDQPSGVIIAGAIGSGKTALIEQLVAHSCFGDGKTGLVQGNDNLIRHTARPVNKGHRCVRRNMAVLHN